MGLSCVVLWAEKPTFQKLDAEGIEGIAKARERVDAFAVATAAFDGEDHVRTGTGGKFGDRSDTLDTRQGADAYTDPANAPLHRAYALGPLEIRLTPGQMVMFPSYVFHEVAPFYGRDTRITVATNCWFA